MFTTNVRRVRAGREGQGGEVLNGRWMLHVLHVLYVLNVCSGLNDVQDGIIQYL